LDWKKNLVEFEKKEPEILTDEDFSVLVFGRLIDIKVDRISA